ncbi:MAG: dTDP-4-dehydrorhamnose 3,5-epimerase family protein [Thermodesulfobacteriaceae bacterium]|jgi:dTDP-4-dehydrorhamnose 3,5-epimerase
MGKFRKIETALKGVYILEPTVFEDYRGFFVESYYFREVEDKINFYYTEEER